MKEQYIDLMEKALSAYSDEHIQRYFNDVRTHGLTEHGFPRLTANIGILIAHGRRLDLLPLFLEMMEFCCKTIPTVKAANDFSVREIICCLWELERSGAVAQTDTVRWRGYLASIEPTVCYDKIAQTPTERANNWALFTGVSEFFRQSAGLCNSEELIDMQLDNQLRKIDENGMYMDAKTPTHQPMVYDLVPRGLLVMLLNQGYRGRFFAQIDDCLRRAGLLTLDMQSPNGEIGFGGRSAQFLHNEPWMITIFEYEAKRYASEGNHALAARFKAASARALAVVSHWLNKTPIRHIKNRYPTETQYGCESYAYFDKYMITAASFLYTAYMVADDSIPFEETSDLEPCVAMTSEHFHKLFLKAGGYGLEFDLNADPHYDASGLGRVHHAGAPSALCMSCPCPASPDFTVDIDPPIALSLCSAVRAGTDWRLGAQESAKYEVVETSQTKDCASATLLCHFDDGSAVEECYTVDERGVSIRIKGDGEIGFALPAFCFDGECAPEIVTKERSLTVSYEGWACRYTTDGRILNMEKVAANRNGHYQAFLAAGETSLNVKIEIVKI